VCNKSANKSLTFTISGAGQKALHVIQSGHAMSAQFTGQGQLKLSGILTPNRALEVLSPAALQPTMLRCVSAQEIERSFQVSNLRKLGAGSIRIAPDPGGSALRVEDAAGTQFDLLTQTFAGGAMRQAKFTNLQADANSRAVLTPADWNNLATTALTFDLRRMNGQQIRNQRIQPGP
jgi:hypothetical protein